LCECSAPDDAPIPGHLTPDDVAAVVREAAPRRVVLTHLYPVMDTVDAEARIRPSFDGEVVRGEDGMRFPLAAAEA
jgi:ribonuclease BN (tRNA processing enzyme)